MPLLRYERGWGKFPRRIYLATPVGDGKPFDNYVASLPNAFLALAKAKIGADYGLEGGNVHVDDARNSLVRHFLTTDCTDLVFIDADVGFRAEDLVKLVSVDRDIVAGIYPKKQDETEFPVYWLPEQRTIEADGCVEVARVPTGFLRIRRHVLETLAETVTKFRGNGDGPMDPLYPLIFERSLKGGKRWSGDYEFCNKAHEAGFKVHIIPDMWLTHQGTKTWGGNLAQHQAQKSGEDHPEFIAAMVKVKMGVPATRDWLTLVEHWGNPYAAPPELLFACWQAAKDAKGPILETGSGLTTLVMGLAAEQAGQTVYALEHDVDWYRKTKRALDRYGIKGVELGYAPLAEYGADRWWYDWVYEGYRPLPNQFDLVLIDGPQRRFGREGLFETNIADCIRDARWLMDDADDPKQIALIEKYAPERMARMQVIPSNMIPGRAFAAIPRARAESAKEHENAAEEGV